jgi:hypothetical protein
LRISSRKINTLKTYTKYSTSRTAYLHIFPYQGLEFYIRVVHKMGVVGGFSFHNQDVTVCDDYKMVPQADANCNDVIAWNSAVKHYSYLSFGRGSKPVDTGS